MADGAWERRSLRAPTPCQVMDFNQYVVSVAQGEEEKEKKAYLEVRRARNNLCYGLICIMHKIASFMHAL